MSYFALLDSDSENEATGAKIAVKKEPKDSKPKPAAVAAPVKAADTKVDTKQKENKSAPAANANKDVKKPKDAAAGADKKPVKKDISAGVQAVDPDADAVKEKSHADREHGKTKRHTGAEGSYGGRGHQGGRGRGAGRGEGDKAPRDDKPVDPSDHEHGLEKAPRKREFDRKSSTGRSGEQRKGGRGPHSFGNEKQEGAEAEKNPASAEVEVEALEGAEVEGGEEGGAAAEPAVPVVEEPKTFTYEEYLEKKKAESKVINKELFSEPKAIRVVETSEFQGLKTVASEETVFMAKPMKSATDKKVAPQRSVAKATTVDVGFKVVPAEDASAAGTESSYGGRGGGRGGRGGRGGDREGGSGRGRSDRGAPAQSRTSAGGAFDLNSLAESFPSL